MRAGVRERLRREELTHLQEADRMEEEAVMRGAADRAADAPTGVAVGPRGEGGGYEGFGVGFEHVFDASAPPCV